MTRRTDIAATILMAFLQLGSSTGWNLGKASGLWIRPRSWRTAVQHNRRSTSVSSNAGASESGDPTAAACRILGICGGIGSGKSAACQLLVSELGCAAHIEADSLAHAVYRPGSEAVRQVQSAFGTAVVDDVTGEIDRKQLGELVFADQAAMARLERIVWPHVRTAVLERIEQVRRSVPASEPTVVVVEAAVLLDAGWNDFLDGLWVIQVERETARARLLKHRGLSTDEANKRLDAQVDRRGIGNIGEEVARGFVSSVIHNDGNLDQLRQALLEKLHDSKAWYPRKQSPDGEGATR